MCCIRPRVDDDDGKIRVLSPQNDLLYNGMSVLDNPLSGRPGRRKRVLSSSSRSEDESSQSQRQSTSTTSNRLIRCLKGCLKRKLEKAAAGTIYAADLLTQKYFLVSGCRDKKTASNSSSLEEGSSKQSKVEQSEGGFSEVFKEKDISQGHANDVFNYEAPDDTKLVTIDLAHDHCPYYLFQDNPKKEVEGEGSKGDSEPTTDNNTESLEWDEILQMIQILIQDLETWLPSATAHIEVNHPGEEAEAGDYFPNVTASAPLSTSTDFLSGGLMSDSNTSVNSESSQPFGVTTPPSSPTEAGPLKKLKKKKSRKSLKIRKGLRESVENLTTFGKKNSGRKSSQEREGQDN